MGQDIDAMHADLRLLSSKFDVISNALKVCSKKSYNSYILPDVSVCIAVSPKTCLPVQDELLAVKTDLEQRQLACVKMLLPHGDSMQEATKQARTVQYPACMAHSAVR